MAETVEVRLARIEEMLKAHFVSIAERCERRSAAQDKHEARIAALEAWRNQARGGWWVISALYAVSGLIGAIVGILFPRL